MEEPYKYTPYPNDVGLIIFLEVVKPIFWDGKHDERPAKQCTHIPVGSITWVRAGGYKFSLDGTKFTDDCGSIHIEGNRYGINMDPSCFEILQTFNQKLKR
jgi:hypothetical protein